MRGSVPALGRLALALLACAQVAACAGSVSPASGSDAIGPPTATMTAAAARAARTPTLTAGSGVRVVPPLDAAPIATATATWNSDFVARVVARTNQDRLANGCPALVPNLILMGTAQAHSADMALNHFFGHNSSDGVPPWARIKAAGYNWSAVAENIAAGYDTPEDVVDGWFNETPPNDPHRANILNCRLHDIGVGYYYLANDPNTIAYHSYWTEDFGTLANG